MDGLIVMYELLFMSSFDVSKCKRIQLIKKTTNKEHNLFDTNLVIIFYTFHRIKTAIEPYKEVFFLNPQKWDAHAHIYYIRWFLT